MPTKEETENQKSLLATYRRNLAVFRRQQAEFGSATPPHIIHGTAEARQQIDRIKLILRQWGEDVEDYPDDSEVLDKKSRLTRSDQGPVSMPGRVTRKTLTVAVISACVAGLLGLAVPMYRLQILPILTSSTTTSVTESKYGDDWQTFFHDDFETKNSSWILGENKDGNTLTNKYISNGKFVWEVEAKELVSDTMGPAIDQTSDFSLTLDAFQANGLRTIAYGLYFRGHPGGEHYSFSITKNQYWSFFIRTNGKWVPIINWSKTNFIKPNSSNKLKVVAEGERFMFFINDEHVGEGIDSRLTEGEVGIEVNVEGAETVRFEFDDFELHTPIRK